MSKKSKYRSSWRSLTQKELCEVNQSLFGNQRYSRRFREGHVRLCLTTELAAVLTLSHGWGWDHYIRFQSPMDVTTYVWIGYTGNSWENLAFRGATKAAKTFFARVGELKL